MSAAEFALLTALELIGLGAADLTRVHLTEAPVRGASPHAVAFVLRPANIIYVVRSSHVFRAAERAADARRDRGSAPFRMLASVLAHEMWHLRHGADERGAYQQQLTTLAALRCDMGCTEYLAVRRSMLAVLKNAARPEHQVNARSQESGAPSQRQAQGPGPRAR